MTRASLGVLLLAAGGAAAARAETLVVRASPLLAPCAEAAVRAFPAGAQVVPGPLAEGAGDVLLGADVEITRALESGRAVLDSEVDLARVPWVLAVPAGNPDRIMGLDDALDRGLELTVAQGPADHEARRALAERGAARLRGSSDLDTLRAARLALVPLSVRPRGDALATTIRPFAARAALSADTRHAEAARALLRFLGSERGQRAFSACRESP
jgi:hypothetical protein